MFSKFNKNGFNPDENTLTIAIYFNNFNYFQVEKSRGAFIVVLLMLKKSRRLDWCR